MRVLAKRGADYLIGEKLGTFEPVLVYSDRYQSLHGPVFVYETRGFEQAILPPSHEAHILDGVLSVVSKHMTSNPEHDEPGEEQQSHAGGGGGAQANTAHFKHDPANFSPIKMGKTQTGAKLEAAIEKARTKLAEGLDIDGERVKITEESAIASMDELFDAANEGQVAYGEEWYNNAGKQADALFERFKDEIPGLTRDMAAVVLAGASPGAKWDDNYGTPEQAKTSNQVTAVKILEAWADNLPVKISEQDVKLARLYIEQAKMWTDLELPKAGEYSFRDLAKRDPRLAFLFKTNFESFDPKSNRKVEGGGFGWGGSPVQVLPGLKALSGAPPDEALGEESKVRSFYTNIARSMTGQKDEHATLDIWMARAMQSNRKLSRAAFGKFYGEGPRYELMRRWVEKAAQKRGLSPKQYQAIVWAVIARPDEEQKERFKLAKESKQRKLKLGKAFGLDTEGDEFDMMWLARAIAHERGEDVDDDPFFGPWDEDDQARLDSLLVTKATLIHMAVRKHLAGTEHDHDQSEHGRGGGGSDPYVAKRTVKGTTIERDEETGYSTLVRASDGKDEDGKTIVMIEEVYTTKQDVYGTPPVGKNTDEYGAHEVGTMTEGAWQTFLNQSHVHVRPSEDIERIMRGEILDGIDTLASKLGSDPEVIKQDLDGMFKEFEEGTLAIRRKDKGTLAFLEQDVMLTQFSTGRTSGYFGADSRSVAELNMFGYQPDLDPDKRPKYGYLLDKASDTLYTDQQANNYGDWRFDLKDEVKDRTTATLGDSLGDAESGRLRARPVRGLNHEVIGSSGRMAEGMVTAYRNKAPIAGATFLYVEAQVHGKLKLSDVARISVDLGGSEMIHTARAAGISPTDTSKIPGDNNDHSFRGPSIDKLIEMYAPTDNPKLNDYGSRGVLAAMDTNGRRHSILKALKQRGFKRVRVVMQRNRPSRGQSEEELTPSLRLVFEREED